MRADPTRLLGVPLDEYADATGETQAHRELSTEEVVTLSRLAKSNTESDNLIETDRPLVVLVSVDGLRPKDLVASDAPGLKGLIRHGSHNLQARTITPSLTLPGHTSLLTGRTPDRHGIEFNQLRLDYGPVRCSTVFEVLHAARIRTGMVCSVEDIRYHLDRPGSIDYKTGDYNEERVVERALRFIAAPRPQFLFLYFGQVDTAGHTSGWGSPEQLAAIASVDRALLRLIAALVPDRQATLLVTADHGGHRYDHGTDDPLDMTIPWIAWGRGIRSANVLGQAVVTCDTPATVLALFGQPVPADWTGRVVQEALGH